MTRLAALCFSDRCWAAATIAFVVLAGVKVAACQAADASGVLLPEGQPVVSAGTTLEKRVYRRPASPDQAAVVIHGQGFTVDFRGTVLQGRPDKSPGQ